MFSKTCEHAIRATLLVASNSLEGRRVSIKEIAEATAAPVAFTAKIMQQLCHGGILYSVQGNSQRPCPLHERFSVVRAGLKAMLEETTVLDLTLGLKQGLTFLRA